jgi:glutaminyl-peptide cyclotransferase
MAKKNRDLVLGLFLLLAAGLAGAYLMFKTPEAQSGQRTEFAAGRDGDGPPFSGEQAMAYLRQICSLGPRISATPQHAQMVDLLEKHFRSLGFQVERQSFQVQQRSKLLPVNMVNLIARWQPEIKNRLLVCTHYDTRPLADQEPNANHWQRTFLGANDGASGPAWMMEMARHLKSLETPLGVDFVCFDGEEYIFDNRSSELGGDMYFLGSRHFAEAYDRQRRSGGGFTYREGVLLDMIAGKNPRFPYEGHSLEQAGELLERLWKIAERQRCTAFVKQYGEKVLDDHLELHKVGIPVVDIVPVTLRGMPGTITYPFWHRLGDTPENCAPDGMVQVARVLGVWMKTTK